jgi:molybdopterin converting factor small subunit
MKILVILHGAMRGKLPAEARGRVTLHLSEGARIQDIFERLDIPDPVLFALNEQMGQDRSSPLHDGDTLRFFRPAAGGGPWGLDRPADPNTEW